MDMEMEMEMDDDDEEEEEMEEFSHDPFTEDDGIIDLDYEFDASMFYDFTRSELEHEAAESESWFKFAGTYPPSPFVVKLNREREARRDCTSVPAKRKDSEVSEINENYSAEDIIEVRMKSPVKVLSRSSTLMKPTASYLAKQKQPRGVHSNRLLQRFQCSLGNSEASSQRSSLNDSHATKRQKLEAGYVGKIPPLKQQTSLLHKLPKKAVAPEVNPSVTRIKSTIPREPNLETAIRAQRYRSRINAASSEHSKLNTCNFKARPLNRKILEGPTLLPPKKSIPQMPEFQVFHLKTLERAIQHISHDVVNSPYVSSSRNKNKGMRRQKSLHDTKQEKCGKDQSLDKILSHNEESGAFLNCKDEITVSGEFNSQEHKRFSDEPPTELLNKLSLSSECRNSSRFQCKIQLPSNCSKENVLDQDHEVMNIFLQNSPWCIIAKQCLSK